VEEVLLACRNRERWFSFPLRRGQKL